MLPLAALGVEFLFDPPSAGVWLGIVLLGLAATFLPAVWVCVRPAPARRTVLRAETVWCLLLALAGSLLVDATLAVLLTVPTLLLALAAGLIFQTSPGNSRK